MQRAIRTAGSTALDPGERKSTLEAAISSEMMAITVNISTRENPPRQPLPCRNPTLPQSIGLPLPRPGLMSLPSIADAFILYVIFPTFQ
jgi:hypothetical protein